MGVGLPPQYSTSVQSDCGVSPDPDVDFFSHAYASPYDPGSAAGPFGAQASTSSFMSSGLLPRRMLTFTVEYRGRNINAQVMDSEKVGKWASR